MAVKRRQRKKRRKQQPRERRRASPKQVKSETSSKKASAAPKSGGRAQAITEESTPPELRADERAAAFVLLAATASVAIGLLCDISWDASIGRDSFWSPPHMAVNFGGMVAAACCLWLSLRATLAKDGEGSVKLGPVRAPLGAAVALWGAAAIGAWGLLDTWWGDSFGLGATEWGPPHLLISAGVVVLGVGTWLLMLSQHQRAQRRTPDQDVAKWPTHIAAALTVVLAVTTITEFSLPNMQRTAWFHQVSCGLLPLFLVWFGRTRLGKWPATYAALGYMGVVALLVWLLPLVPATPAIGPIYQHIEHLLPPRFPLLLVLPALACDLWLRDSVVERFGRARVGLLLGLTFAVVFGAVQWQFSAFLLSPLSDNVLFAGGGKHWPFFIDVGLGATRFWDQGEDPVTMLAALLIVGAACASSSLGLLLGGWTRELRR